MTQEILSLFRTRDPGFQMVENDAGAGVTKYIDTEAQFPIAYSIFTHEHGLMLQACAVITIPDDQVELVRNLCQGAMNLLTVSDVGCFNGGIFCAYVWMADEELLMALHPDVVHDFSLRFLEPQGRMCAGIAPVVQSFLEGGVSVDDFWNIASASIELATGVERLSS